MNSATRLKVKCQGQIRLKGYHFRG